MDYRDYQEMKKLTESAELYQIMGFSRSPFILSDLAPGVIIHDVIDGFFLVQVPGEPEARRVSMENVWIKNGALLEILPTYTDDALSAIHRKLNEIDPHIARNIIDCLEEVGFDIESEDFRTIQNDHHFTFDFRIPALQADKLIVKIVAHWPSFCARWGHAWECPEEMWDGSWRAECSNCGAEKKGDMAFADSLWRAMSWELAIEKK